MLIVRGFRGRGRYIMYVCVLYICSGEVTCRFVICRESVDGVFILILYVC